MFKFSLTKLRALASQLTRSTFFENNFYQCSSIGISAQDYSNILIDGNILTGANETSTTGVKLIGSSPDILGNSIKDFNKGVSCATQSSPILEDGEYGGHNVITSNTYGVICDNGSNAVLGLLGQDPDDGGQNSIYANTTYDVKLTNNCTVMAENNWWGSSGGQFSVASGCTLDTDPALTTDPNPGSAPIIGGDGDAVAKRKSGPMGGSPLMDPFGGHPMMEKAIDARIAGDHEGAITILEEIISDGEETIEVKRWAVGEVIANATMDREIQVSTYLADLVSRNSELMEAGRTALVTALVDEKRITNAIAEMDYNIEYYPNTLLECSGLFGNFAVALFRDNDERAAQTYLDSLVAKFPDSEETELAVSQLAQARGDGMSLSPETETGLRENIAGFELSQNYPNPFNPVTTISYHIPVDSRVNIKVFDVLGKEVVTLVDEFESAGSHRIAFDAGLLASGIYFYRLRAGDFTATRRLVVIK